MLNHSVTSLELSSLVFVIRQILLQNPLILMTLTYICCFVIIVASISGKKFTLVVYPDFLVLRDQDVEVVDMCLQAIKAFASFHYKEVSGGKVGLGSHATSYKNADGSIHEGVLSRFLRSLLQLLLFEDYRLVGIYKMVSYRQKTRKKNVGMMITS